MNIDWPKPNRDQLPDMYRDIESLVERAGTILTDDVPMTERRLIFDQLTTDELLDMLHKDPDALVPLFQKVTGLPDREFHALYGESSIGSRLRSYKTDFRNRDNARTFAEGILENLPESLHVETALYTFAKMWESDQRRFARMHFEGGVREYLRENDIPNQKDESLPGQPDFVVPDPDNVQVVGEVRVVRPEDIKKRVKNFRDEAREAAKNFPDARFAAIVNLPPYALNDQRDQRRSTIEAPEIDGVFFRDELDDLVSTVSDWSEHG